MKPAASRRYPDPALLPSPGGAATRALAAAAATALGSALFAATNPPFLVNGDFEAKDEDGWSYAGRHDGSHGVFSDPSRPGSHTYLLQLAGTDAPGFSAIVQPLNLQKGHVYRLRFDLWQEGGNASSGARGRQSAALGFFTVFDRDLCAPGRTPGWTTVSALFRAPEDRPLLQIRVTGEALQREASTTAIDQVTVEPDGTALPAPLQPGKPLLLSPAGNGYRLAFGYSTAVPDLCSLQEFRERFQQTPAFASVLWDWRQEPQASAPPWPGLSAWVQHGVVPILILPLSPGDLTRFAPGPLAEGWRNLAQEARRWRYPLLLRLAPEMDLLLPPSQAQNFVSFWKSLHRVFQDEEARNVRWFWTPSGLGPSSHPFYPGDGTVDLVGFSLPGQQPDTAFRTNLDEARTRYPALPVAVAQSAASPSSLPDLIRSPSALAFFTLGKPGTELPAKESEEALPIAQALSQPASLPPAQLLPPNLSARFIRHRYWVTLILQNLDPPGSAASPPCPIRVEWWDGHPFQDGRGIKSKDGLTLRPGQRKTLRQFLRAKTAARTHVLIDRGTDPRFLPAHAGDLDWKNDPDLILLPSP